jgi:hypothetical protein
LDNFTSKVRTNIGSLSVNTTTDSSEESDSRTTKSVTSNGFKEMSDMVLILGISDSFVNNDKDLKN